MRFNLFDFGAVGDGKADDTAAVRAAFMAAGERGGTVVFAAGCTFRTGYVRIFSHTEVCLEAGSVWKASDRFDDFLPDGGHFTYAKRDLPSFHNSEYTGGPQLKFIHALDAEDISFTGTGRIDGNEEIFYGEIFGDHIEGLFYPRAPLLYLENIDRLTLQNVTLQNSAFWTLHMVGCRHVVIDSVTIDNNFCMANCDGIDPDACTDVRIENCRVISADDCIVLKTTEAAAKYGPCSDVIVKNCVLSSKSAAFKFGSESEALFANVTVSDCTITGTNRAISLQLRDKGSIENVCFQNIRIDTHLFPPENWWGKAEPIAITANRRHASTDVGHIKNVVFTNIMSEAENGILIYGDAEKDNIENITFTDCSFRLRRASEYPVGIFDVRPGEGETLEARSLRHVTVEHAQNIRFENVMFSEDAEMGALLER